MNNSNELNEIFKALSLFQGELENASKNVDKQGINWKYADLAGCINTAKPHLVKHGLAVTQFMGMSVNGKQSLNTMLTHSSGQYISDETELPDAVLHGSSGKNPVQVLGSAITYIRRYNYAAIIGMAQEDDDGVSADGVKTKPNQNKTQEDEKPVNWYQDSQFKQEKANITEAIRGGMPPEDVIKNLQEQGFAINKKIREEIKAI